MKYEKKALLIIIIVSFVILFVGIYVEKNSSSNNTDDKVIENNTLYLLHYHTNTNYYDISYDTESMGSFNIIKYEVVDCYIEPCDPIKIDEYSTNTDSSYISSFIKLFNNKNEITLNSVTTSDYNKALLFEIIKNNNNSSDLYKVTYDVSYSSEFQKGYYVQESDNGLNIIISNGPRPNSGYGITVSNIQFMDDGVYIYVKEKTPEQGEIGLTVITYPIATVEVYSKPSLIKVFDESNNEYQLLK